MRTFVKTTLAILLATALVGCDSVLQKPEPSTSVSQEVALSNPDAIRGVRTSMYDRFHSNALSTDWLLGASALADGTIWRGNEERHQNLNVFNREDGLGTGAYNNLYNLINDANLLIGGIQKGALDKPTANKYKAEARFMRALAMHHAVRIFGYDPAGPEPADGLVQPNSGPGQNFNLGIVIRTKPTLSPQDANDKARSTVHEVYDQIVKDLKQSISLFKGLPGDVRTSSYHFANEAAAHALLARVHLYQRNWSAANNQAQKAIDVAAARFGSRLAKPSELQAMFDETTGDNPEGIFQVSTDPQNSIGVNNALPAFTSVFWVAQVPTQNLLNQYGKKDKRLDAWYGPCLDEVNGVSYANTCKDRNKNGYELQKYQSEVRPSAYADDHVHLRIAEMVLIQAEARLHTQGVSAAITRLNDLREKRNASMLDPANYNMESAMNEILAERRRELVAEGHRFFDLKRLGRDIPKFYGIPDVPFNSFKILDELPENQLKINKKLKQNPGYN
ncbi:MAG: RagB/SusD family nutrient uptake outer membrane protein [Salinibacter sp.]